MEQKPTSLICKLASLLHRSIPKDTSRPTSYQAQLHRLHAIDGIYVAIEALDLALEEWGGLKPEEAEQCMKMALRHLLNRAGIEMFMQGMSMKRVAGTATLMGNALSSLDRQVHVETAPTVLRRSMDDMLRWIEASLVDGMPVVVQLDNASRSFDLVVEIDQTHLMLIGGGFLRSVRRDDRVLRRGLQSAGMFRVRVLRLEPIFVAAKRPMAFGQKITIHG